MQGVLGPKAVPTIRGVAREMEDLRTLLRIVADDGNTNLVQASFPAAQAWDLRVFDVQEGGDPVYELLDQANTTGLKASLTAPGATNPWSLDGTGFTFDHTLQPLLFATVGGHLLRLEYEFKTTSFGRRLGIVEVAVEPART